MNTFTKTLALAAIVAAAGLSVSAGAAISQSVGEIASDLRGQVTNLSLLATVVSFVVGVALAIMGLIKFKQNANNPNDPSAKMSSAFILVFVGAALVAIPAVLGSGIQTVFGTGASVTDARDGFDQLR